MEVGHETRGEKHTLNVNIRNAVNESVDRSAYSAPFKSEPNDGYERAKLTHKLALLERLHFDSVRQMAKDSFWFFLTEVLFPLVWRANYTEGFHKKICDDIQSLKEGENYFLLVPRASRKTYIATIAHTIWRIVCDPNIRIMLIGDRDDVVLPFARIIRSAFVKGSAGFENFQKFFPDYLIKDRRLLLQASQFTHPLRTISLPDPTFRATYLGVAEAYRCDVMIFDDAIAKRRVTSPEMSMESLQKMMDAFPFVDRINSPYQNILICGTRRAYHDPYGFLIGENHDELHGIDGEVRDKISKFPFRVNIRHVLEEPDIMCDICPPHVVRMHPHGKPTMSETAQPILHPILTRKKIDDMFNEYCINPSKGESEFWHEYMNVCIAPSQQKLKKEWFDLVVDRVVWPTCKRRVICLDDASKDLQESGIGDYSVALFGEFGEDGRLMLVYGLRDDARIWTRDEFTRRIVAWCQGANWWPLQIVKEKTSTDNFLIDLMTKFKNVYHPVYATSVARGRTGKEDWIVGATQGPLERGEVVFGKAFPSSLRLRMQAEAASLGRIAHEDAIDALALFFTKDVRVAAQPPIQQQAGNWIPPELSLYDPDRSRPPSTNPQNIDSTFFEIAPRRIMGKDESDWW